MVENENNMRAASACSRESAVSYLQTIWSHLTWSDKWVIAINIFLAVVFYASWRRKKQRLAEGGKSRSE